MSHLLEEPTAVVVVGGAGSGAASALTGGAATAVVHRSSVDAAVATLEERDDVGCVVLTGEPGERAADGCRRIRAADRDLPVVVLTEVEPDAAAAVADVEHCRLLPRSVSPTRLREVVDAALADYEERRDRAANSSILETLLSESNVSIYAKDDQARVVRMADVEYGPDPDDVRGKTDLEVWSDETPEMARQTYDDDLDVVESGEPVYEQRERFDQGGYTHWSETTKVPWRDEDGEVQGLVGVSRDVTEDMERAEELRERRQLIEQFASYVSHDLKTPLQVASGSLRLARETGDGDAFRKVGDALERMEETIDDLSELARRRAETGTTEEIREALPDRDPDETIETPRLGELVEDVWDVIGADEATLEVSVPPAATITADPETIRPLLENLLKNAVAHAGPDVTVRVGLTDRSGFYVADDGPGIPEDERDRVVEEGYTTAEDGTGMGLTIVSEVAAENGWTLALADSRAGGARVEINDCKIVADRLDAARPDRSVDLIDDQTVGDAGVAGAAERVETVDRWIVTGGGENIWGQTNEFHFLYGRATPPVRLQARIRDLDAVDEYSKTGLMIRGGLDEDAPFGFVGQTAEHGTELAWRESADGRTRTEQFEEPESAYEWYRIECVDGAVTCSVSPDGDEWTALDQRSLPFDDEVYAGLAVCSHDGQTHSVAEFEGVSAYELEDE
ncbi:PAS domain-containing protein [Halomicrobium salinisoli]|uniref:PAS domain-containing protein n=1 Tax=Halomicrobium salinisoli TaxID=2878391 RepID=UPI001CF04685|nr:PAS domain-containing protein [Halomicrobium salinisoli]